MLLLLWGDKMKPVYKIYKMTADEGFELYTVMNAADGTIIETFYTLWDAEDFVAAETA